MLRFRGRPIPAWGVLTIAGVSGAVCGATLTACARSAPTYEQIQEAWRAEAEEARARYAGYSFEEFERTVYKEPIPDGVYIVNGDTPIANEKLLREFFERNVAIEPSPRGKDHEFAIRETGGLDVIWSESQKRNLTYCISDQFGNRHSRVVTAMEAASAEWEAVADLDFLYMADQDASCTPDNRQVVFNITPVGFGKYYGRAFWPSDARSGRQLFIDEVALAQPPDRLPQLVGVFRHELGHVLGAKHEHVRPDAGDCHGTDTEMRYVTDYDPFSVMHYPRCGSENYDFTLSDADKSGVACVYGPADNFEIDPDICTSLGWKANLDGHEQFAGDLETLVFDDEAVLLDGEKAYGGIFVAPNTPFVARLEGVGEAPGDADLYLKFNDFPAPGLIFDCRPYRPTSDETCQVDVPADGKVARLLVRGYTQATYKLTVSFYGPSE